MNKLLCFGMGYCATALAEALPAESWTIVATATSDEKRAAHAKKGYEAHLFTREAPLPVAALAGVTHVVSSVPPDEDGDPVVDVHGADIATLTTLTWAGLLSTTGVYGDHDGGWVDEDTPLTPTGDRSKRRVVAEAAWLALHRDYQVPVHIFRLAGIYGPARNPLDAIRAGTARRIVKPGQVMGRIHRDDIVGALQASMAQPAPGTVYNVSDDEPAVPADVVAYGCNLLGVAPPPEVPFEDADLSPMARSFYADNKRVRNDRLKNDLGYTFKYPNYRAGLEALLGEPPQPPRSR